MSHPQNAPLRWPWIERSFRFDFPVAKLPDLLERWRGTPVRLDDMLRNVSRDALTASDGGWSILQNVGHLLDLEYLPRQRIDEILAGKDVLVAADMANRATNQADHNSRDKDDLIAEFRKARLETVTRVESLPESDLARAALHPRIKQPMRIVDIVYFDCEHDDYHLGRIRTLLNKFARKDSS